jgi:hypothetical protein
MIARLAATLLTLLALLVSAPTNAEQQASIVASSPPKNGISWVQLAIEDPTVQAAQLTPEAFTVQLEHGQARISEIVPFAGSGGQLCTILAIDHAETALRYHYKIYGALEAFSGGLPGDGTHKVRPIVLGDEIDQSFGTTSHAADLDQALSRAHEHPSPAHKRRLGPSVKEALRLAEECQPLGAGGARQLLLVTDASIPGASSGDGHGSKFAQEYITELAKSLGVRVHLLYLTTNATDTTVLDQLESVVAATGGDSIPLISKGDPGLTSRGLAHLADPAGELLTVHLDFCGYPPESSSVIEDRLQLKLAAGELLTETAEVPLSFLPEGSVPIPCDQLGRYLEPPQPPPTWLLPAGLAGIGALGLLGLTIFALRRRSKPSPAPDAPVMDEPSPAPIPIPIDDAHSPTDFRPGGHMATAPSGWRLRVVHSEGLQLDSLHPIRKTPFHIGARQGPGIDLLLHHDMVSGKHARIDLQDQGSVLLTDLGSTNGTFVGRQRLDKNVPRQVQERDVITIWRVSFVIEREDGRGGPAPDSGPRLQTSGEPSPSVPVEKTTFNPMGRDED